MKQIITDHFSEIMLSALCSGAGIAGVLALCVHQPDIAKASFAAASFVATALVALAKSGVSSSPNA